MIILNSVSNELMTIKMTMLMLRALVIIQSWNNAYNGNCGNDDNNDNRTNYDNNVNNDHMNKL